MIRFLYILIIVSITYPCFSQNKLAEVKFKGVVLDSVNLVSISEVEVYLLKLVDGIKVRVSKSVFSNTKGVFKLSYSDSDKENELILVLEKKGFKNEFQLDFEKKKNCFLFKPYYGVSIRSSHYGKPKYHRRAERRFEKLKNIYCDCYK